MALPERRDYTSKVITLSIINSGFILLVGGLCLMCNNKIIIKSRPRYRKKKASYSSELTVSQNRVRSERFNATSLEPPPTMLIPSLGPSRSVRETIQEVKMVQVYFSSLFFFDMKVVLNVWISRVCFVICYLCFACRLVVDWLDF